MNRLDALKAAESLVDRLEPKKNERGYDRQTSALGDRVAAVLRVAEWLRTEDDAQDRERLFREATNRLGEFVASCLLVTNDRSHAVSYDEAWSAYTTWIANTGSYTTMLKRHMFLDILGERAERAKSNGRRVFRGLKLCDPAASQVCMIPDCGCSGDPHP